METIHYSKTTWIQVLRPKKADLEKLKKQFGFHSITLGELERPSLRSKVERYKDYIYMVIHFPIYNEKERTVEPGEIDFLLTKNTVALATVKYRKIQCLDEFKTRIASDKDFQEKCFKDPFRLLYHLLSANFEFSQRQLEHIRKNIAKCEKEIYRGNERRMLEELAFLMRDLTNFRRIIKFHHDILKSFQAEVAKLFGSKYKPYLENLRGQAQRVSDVLEMYYETARILQETNQSLFTAKTNEAIKILTVIAVFTFPLTLLATILSWNTNFIPIVGMKYDFWILICSFAIIALSMYAYFKYRKWI